MPPHSVSPVVCLIMDRLSVEMLGAYGNTWVGTPCFDNLAFSSILFEQNLLTSPFIKHFYNAVWHGGAASGDALPGRFGANGLDTLLITDEIKLKGDQSGFADISFIAPEFDSNGSCTETEKFFAAAAEQLARVDKSALVWLHSNCLGRDWDAPYEMRKWYAAEEDPPPPKSQDAPHFLTGPDTDPDEILGWVQAYAAQVSHWDQCLGHFLDVIDDHPILKDALLVVGGCRGFPLGEHRAVGAGSLDNPDCELYGELLHFPMLCRVPGGPYAVRHSGLMQPEDLFAMMRQWLDQDGKDAALLGTNFLEWENFSRSAVISEHSNGGWSVRTPAWFFRYPGQADKSGELYLKPDDRWEVNNVADRCDDVVQAIERLYRDAKAGKPIEPIDSLLV